ncbi:MAG: ABC transporter ATP-binding protein [Clostridia bacterium]
MIEVKNLTLRYGEVTIFKGLSFSLEEGEILGVEGANGSGKSSLCLCASGLLDTERDGVFFDGEVLFDGVDIKKMSIKERTERVGVIFQNPDNQLFSPLVEEELAFAPENLGVPREEIKARIAEALELCGVSHLIAAKTNSLSGGEKQLVAISAVLAQRPKVIIADEITARVDIDGKVKVRQILKDFAARGGSVLLVSHNPRDLEIATKVIALEKGRDYAN